MSAATWLALGVLALEGVSLVLHASHNKKANALGDRVDALEKLLAANGAGK